MNNVTETIDAIQYLMANCKRGKWSDAGMLTAISHVVNNKRLTLTPATLNGMVAEAAGFGEGQR